MVDEQRMVSERTSRPLASLVREGRLWGSFVLAAGIVFVLAGVFVDGTLAAVIFLAIGAPIFGWIQVREQRKRLARALETSASPPTQTRESTKATRMRMVFAALYLVLVGVVIGVAEELWWFGFSAFSFVGGMYVGMGAGFVLAARSLARWQIANHAELLHEPVWRWSREGRRRHKRGLDKAGRDPIFLLELGGPT